MSAVSYTHLALADFKRDYGQHLRDTTAPYPGIPEMLAKLKANGVQLAVFSNKADVYKRQLDAWVHGYFYLEYNNIGAKATSQQNLFQVEK